MYAKKFTLYFCRTIRFDGRVSNLLYYIIVLLIGERNDNVACVTLKRIKLSICLIINIKLSTVIFGPIFRV